MSKKKKQIINVPFVHSNCDPILGQTIIIGTKQEEVLVEDAEKLKYTTNTQSLLNQRFTKTPFNKKGKRGK